VKKIPSHTKRKWWYKTIRSVNWFSFRYWWFIWLFFLLGILLFLLKCCNDTTNRICKNRNELNIRLNSIDSLLYNCCECIDNEMNSSLLDDPPGTYPCDEKTKSGNEGITQNTHDLGENAGVVTITYEMYSVPDKLEVFYEGKMVASTGKFISNSGLLTFNYTPNNDTFCSVVVTGPAGTDWIYSMGCPR
jgi:hypothetical protein